MLEPGLLIATLYSNLTNFHGQKADKTYPRKLGEHFHLGLQTTTQCGDGTYTIVPVAIVSVNTYCINGQKSLT